MMKMKICVLFVILALGSQHASGVEVYKGKESVLLPCRFVAPIPENHAVVWRREDLSSPIVHSIVDGKDDVENQNRHYDKRTSMRAHALQSGDLSLTLRNPTFTDSGTYTCVTRSRGVDKEKTEVLLLVTEPPPLLTIILLAVLLLLSAVVVFLLHRVKERQKLMTVGQLSRVEVREGTQSPSVVLPYKPTLPLPEGFRVEWIFVTDTNNKVCVFENGEIKLDQQHEDYRERAVMESYPPKKKKETDQLNQPEVDLSLTLKKPVCKDGGVYLCFIYDKDGKPVTLKVVTLLVKEPVAMSIRASLLESRMISKSYNEISLLQQERRLSQTLKKCEVVEL